MRKSYQSSYQNRSTFMHTLKPMWVLYFSVFLSRLNSLSWSRPQAFARQFFNCIAIKSFSGCFACFKNTGFTFIILGVPQESGTLASIQILLFRGLLISSPVFSKLISALLHIPLSLPNPRVSASRICKIVSDIFRIEFCIFGYLFVKLCLWGANG